MIQKERIFDLTPDRNGDGEVLYWMSREQRISDNPGLLYAQYLAEHQEVSLKVVFTLADQFLGATLRQYDFMIMGLHETARSLHELNIPFYLLQGDPPRVLESIIKKHPIGTVVTDFDPLKVKRKWVSEAIHSATSKFLEVDGHNIVPVRWVSNKVEFGAYTLRPKIHRHLDRFLEEYPEVKKMSQDIELPVLFEPGALLEELDLDRSVTPVSWLNPGSAQAMKVMSDFIQNRLPGYSSRRNDPNLQMTSDLSPYLHFGQISSMRIAIDVLKQHPSDEDSDAFLEELIVRKELSDNFCHYHPDYDNTGGFHDWAQKTHDQHRRDEREYIYSLEQLEKGETHDPLWNAAQMQMVKTGKMHGYMRMYWAKKILEWTENPEKAMDAAIYLNDRYELDGRDPNGYAGIAWSIGGVHDRAWTERPVFGKIRYMNYNGAKRKFDVDKYVRSIRAL